VLGSGACGAGAVRAGALTLVGRAVALGTTQEEVTNMGYIIAWLLGVPVTLLVLFWLFFGR
jgi:hypothetical protein